MNNNDWFVIFADWIEDLEKRQDEDDKEFISQYIMLHSEVKGYDN